MDLTIRNATLGDRPDGTYDIGVHGGSIVKIVKGLTAGERDIDADGHLVVPGFIETHIHLDKACIFDQCKSKKGDLDEAISEVARLKKAFTIDDVQSRAERTLEKALVQGTTHIRTHVEVDPGLGLIGFEGVKAAIETYKWAIDVEICVFPQEGLLNYPGTDELMVEALSKGATCVGAAPYTDSDPHGQIDRVFEMARDFNVDIDMHLDFSADASSLDAEYVCRMADKYKWGGRVAIGHVTKLSALGPDRLEKTAKMLADSGVAVTVLPATDLFLMCRDHDHNIPRGVAPAQKLLEHGVNCSLSTNNVLNPFTPYGDCSLIRMANLFANIAQIGNKSGMEECLNMVSNRSADLLNLKTYGLNEGCDADLIIMDNNDPAMAVAEVSAPLYGFKRGRPTFTRQKPVIHKSL